MLKARTPAALSDARADSRGSLTVVMVLIMGMMSVMLLYMVSRNDQTAKSEHYNTVRQSMDDLEVEVRETLKADTSIVNSLKAFQLDRDNTDLCFLNPGGTALAQRIPFMLISGFDLSTPPARVLGGGNQDGLTSAGFDGNGGTCTLFTGTRNRCQMVSFVYLTEWAEASGDCVFTFTYEIWPGDAGNTNPTQLNSAFVGSVNSYPGIYPLNVAPKYAPTFSVKHKVRKLGGVSYSSIYMN